MIRLLMATGLAAACLVAQEPHEAIERFRALDFRKQAAIVRTIDRTLARSDDPVLRRIAALRLEEHELPEARERLPVHPPLTAAQGGADDAEDRPRVPAGDPAHVAVRERYPRVPFLDELHAEIAYDWQAGRVVKHADLGYAEIFENRVRGHAPHADDAVANILATLDRDPLQRRLAEWFGHAYCDLAPRAYDGITLYEAWFSGEQVDVPDVDAVPFAWDILGRRHLKTPLSGEPRARLYEDIRAAALDYRKYRTLREAAAAAFVRAEPELPEDYGLLVPRFHLLWSKHGDDPEVLAELLSETSRDDLVQATDDGVRADDGADFDRREARKRELLDAEALVRSTALAVLAKLAGDG